MKIAVIIFYIKLIISFYCHSIRGTMIIIIFIFINEKRNNWNKWRDNIKNSMYLYKSKGAYLQKGGN